jgi:hypothetical protein
MRVVVVVVVDEQRRRGQAVKHNNRDNSSSFLILNVPNYAKEKQNRDSTRKNQMLSARFFVPQLLYSSFYLSSARGAVAVAALVTRARPSPSQYTLGAGNKTLWREF